MRDGAEHPGGAPGAFAQVQAALGRGDTGVQGSRRRAGRRRGRRCRRRRWSGRFGGRGGRSGIVAGECEEGGHHIAGEAAVGGFAPGAALLQDGNGFILGDGAEHPGGALSAFAQVQAALGRGDTGVQRGRRWAGRGRFGGRGGFDGSGRLGENLLLAGLAADGGAEDGAGQGVLHLDAAGEIEAQDLCAGVALLGHLHGAPLAHAQAVAVAPGSHREAAGRWRDGPKLIFARIDAHPQGAFQLAENIKGEHPGVGSAVSGVGNGKIQLGIQLAGDGISGRVGRDGGYGCDGGPAAEGAGRLFVQQALQGVALRAGSADEEGLFPGIGVGQIVGVVLHGQVRISADAPGVFDGFGLSAVGGGIIRCCESVAVFQGDALGCVHRPGAGGRGSGGAVVHLVAGGVHHVVEGGGAFHGPHGVGAGGNGLGLQRFKRR